MRQLVADLDVADDAAGHQPGDLDGDHVDPVRGADPHAVAFVVARWRRSRSAEPNWPGRCSTATTSPPTGARCTCASNTDRKMLTRGHRRRRAGRVRRAATASSIRHDQAVGGRDDHTGPGRRHPRRVPEERGAGARGGQAGGAQPAVPAAERGQRRGSPPTNGRPAGCIGGTVERTSSTQPREGFGLRCRRRLAIGSAILRPGVAVADGLRTGPTPARAIPRRIR